MKMFGNIINPWLLVGALGVLLASNALVAYYAYDAGSDNVQSKWDAAITEATNKKLDVKGKQDAIQNAPIDVDVTARRLRKAAF